MAKLNEIKRNILNAMYDFGCGYGTVNLLADLLEIEKSYIHLSLKKLMDLGFVNALKINRNIVYCLSRLSMKHVDKKKGTIVFRFGENESTINKKINKFRVIFDILKKEKEYIFIPLNNLEDFLKNQLLIDRILLKNFTILGGRYLKIEEAFFVEKSFLNNIKIVGFFQNILNPEKELNAFFSKYEPIISFLKEKAILKFSIAVFDEFKIKKNLEFFKESEIILNKKYGINIEFLDYVENKENTSKLLYNFQ